MIHLISVVAQFYYQPSYPYLITVNAPERKVIKPINELENLPQAEIVSYFLLFLSTIHEKYKPVISPISVHFL